MADGPANDAPGATSPTDPGSLSPDSARPRRGSFSFLRRSKSRDSTSARVATSDASGSRKLSRRSKKDKSASDVYSTRAAPPQISKATLPQINAPFGDDIPHTSPVPPPSTSSSTLPPPLPPASRSGYDPNAFYKRHLVAEQKAALSSPPLASAASPPMPVPLSPASEAAHMESMANRGRYSYASSLTSPGVNGAARRVRRRKDPTPFNVLVIGTPHSGKTSFIDFLRSALSRPVRMRHASDGDAAKSTRGHPFSSHYLETELEGERIGLTLWDSVSLEKHIIDIQLREITAFIEGKFHETFTEESKVLRSTAVRDTHIHCVLFVMDPRQLDLNLAAAGPNARPGAYPSKPSHITGGLDHDFEGQVLRGLQGMTTVIPVISKADTITTAHMSYLKRLVWDSFKKLRIDPLEHLNIDSDDDDASAYETAISEDGEPDAEDGPAGSVQSSKYDNAQEVIDEYEHDGDKTPVKANFAKANVDKTPQKGVKTPQHEEVRVSAMSMNVDLPQLPLSLISPDTYDPGTVGRRFPWGFADPYNPDHCDFVKLMENVFSEWRGELRTVARERWYENWRTNRLKKRGPSSNDLNGRSYPQRSANHSQAQRTVSSAAAYGGKSPEARLARTSSLQNVNAKTNGSSVRVSDIGVAVSNGVGSVVPPALPPKTSSYRGVGTY